MGRFLARPARLASAAATACLLLAGCGSATPSTGSTATGTAPTSTAGSGSAAAPAGVIPAGASAAAQLKALTKCTATPAPGAQEHWLVSAGGTLPTYTVPKGSPKVGTSLTGWPTTPMVVLGDCTDTEAWIFTSADSKNFYLAVQVDSTLAEVDGTDAAPWSGDCLQFAFDPQDQQTSAAYGPNDDEMGMILLAGQPSVFQNIGPNSASYLPPGSIPGAEVQITRNNGITLYEAAIPWAGIGSPVAPTFGFNIAVAAGGAPYQAPNWGYEWTQGIIESKSPSDFAQLTFKP